MYLSIITVLLLSYLGSAQIVPIPTTSCREQLYNYYVARGTTFVLAPGTLPPQPVNITLLPGIGAEIVFAFNSIAQEYQRLIPPVGNTNITTVNYVSFDYPWCTTGIQVICGGPLLRNLPKADVCTVVVDYDVFDPYTGGRAFVYNSAAAENATIQPGCENGNIVVRILGNFSGLLLDTPTTITNISYYTYSYTGLMPPSAEALNLSFEEALDEYQQTGCYPTPGTTIPPVPRGQYELVCKSDRLACAVTPRPGLHIEPLLPVPGYMCTGPTGLDNVGDGRIVWSISVYGEKMGPDYGALYTVTFCMTYDAACVENAMNDNTAHYTLAGTRTQYVSPFGSFESVMVINFRNGLSFTTPIYPYAVTDPFIREIPCICGLSMDCGPNGAINLGPTSKVLNPDNAIPVANATNSFFILPGNQTLYLDASGSFDPDNAPNLLTFYWKVYNSTPTPVIITDPFSPNTTVTGDFIVGVYRFIVYVSDGQTVVYDLVNVTVELNIINVILPADFDAQWQFITECPPVGQLPNLTQAIILNGSASYGANPAIPLFYNWTQISGNPITVPFRCDPSTVGYYNLEGLFNTNESIAYFIPASYGIYTFRLTISDNGTSPTRFADIHISVELNFDGPNSTNNNYTDYPDSPNYNIPNRTVPTISFPPTIPPPPFNDLTRSPSNNDPVPTPIPSPFNITPFNNTNSSSLTLIISTIITDFLSIFRSIVFPRLPDPTASEWALLLLIFVGMVLGWILLFGAVIVLLPYDYINSQYDLALPAY